MRRIPIISEDTAINAWNSFDTIGSFDTSELKHSYIGPEDLSNLTDLDLEELRDELDDIIKGFRHKYPDGLPKISGGTFDSLLIEPIHKHLTKFADAQQLADIGFWQWMSNVANKGFYWNLLKWRFPQRQQVNWGITTPAKIAEVYLYRTWLRGHKMHDLSLSSPYHYAKIGGSDVWRSHILRQEFGRDREFVKAFLDTLYDNNGKSKIGTDELRTDLIPALRAWTSSGTFSHLSYDENIELIQHLRTQYLSK